MPAPLAVEWPPAPPDKPNEITMPSQRFPAPSYNRIIETDPQIIKYHDFPGWGARPSLFSGHLTADPIGNDSGPPKAPELGIQHVTGKE